MRCRQVVNRESTPANTVPLSAANSDFAIRVRYYCQPETNGQYSKTDATEAANAVSNAACGTMA